MASVDADYCYCFRLYMWHSGRLPFYIATCPMRIIPKIFSFDENDVPPSCAQRTLNKSRIP